MQRRTTEIAFVFFLNLESLFSSLNLLSVLNRFSKETKGARQLFDEHNYLAHKLHIVVNLSLYFFYLNERGLFFFQVGKQLIVFQNLFREFFFALNQLILGLDVVVGEFLNLNIPVVILVAFAEKLVDNLTAVVLVDASLCQKDHHLVFVDVSVSVDVYCSKLIIEFASFLYFISSELWVARRKIHHNLNFNSLFTNSFSFY